MDQLQAPGRVKKRKAENQLSERLSKRLSLLNLERDGQRLYVPVEQPAFNSPPPNPKSSTLKDVDVMQLDDSKHKVYIYDLDAELSDSGESDDGKLVFLPDIKKHLQVSRIPPSILANSDGELAGNNQLVLYNIPSSLTVPEAQDSVRKAIIETRARARAKKDEKGNDDSRKTPTIITPVDDGLDSRDWYPGRVTVDAPTPTERMVENPTAIIAQTAADDDPDAMDLG
ncbi:hypothetical protein LOCC1_G003345 [Lachnellula occidentalis]|uniref:Uncharacterized protein n=1 Tax=Lachnellula occidentalis TaxID=215460 RepID=A0A8H8S2F6_9HELO|nr:hypothetical protein LOCC1_G003345 [Lachnellula occidentalis]